VIVDAVLPEIIGLDFIHILSKIARQRSNVHPFNLLSFFSNQLYSDVSSSLFGDFSAISFAHKSRVAVANDDSLDSLPVERPVAYKEAGKKEPSRR
jgi:hypothetical protein